MKCQSFYTYLKAPGTTIAFLMMPIIWLALSKRKGSWAYSYSNTLLFFNSSLGQLHIWIYSERVLLSSRSCQSFYLRTMRGRHKFQFVFMITMCPSQFSLVLALSLAFFICCKSLISERGNRLVKKFSMNFYNCIQSNSYH